MFIILNVMRKSIHILLIVILLLSLGCTQKMIEKHVKTNIDTLTINFFDTYKTLFPPAVNDKISLQVVNQLYDGLVSYNPRTLRIQPDIAYEWEVDKTGLVYTFHLNTNVFFYNSSFFHDKVQRLTMDDVLFTFQYLCTNLPPNKNFYSIMFKVKGAEKYYNSHNDLNSEFKIDGIKVINDSTLQISVENKEYPLLDMLALPSASIFSKEAYKKLKESCYIGTGPFSLIKTTSKNREPLELEYNPYYYKMDKDSNYLPYISNVKITFEKSRYKAIDMLKENNLDIILDMNNRDLLEFLKNNIEDIESQKPQYIIATAYKNSSDLQNIFSSRVKDFYTNSLSIVDLSVVTLGNNK